MDVLATLHSQIQNHCVFVSVNFYCKNIFGKKHKNTYFSLWWEHTILNYSPDQTRNGLMARSTTGNQ